MVGFFLFMWVSFCGVVDIAEVGMRMRMIKISRMLEAQAMFFLADDDAQILCMNALLCTFLRTSAPHHARYTHNVPRDP